MIADNGFGRGFHGGQAAAGSVNHCPALPPPSGTLVNVSDVTQLVNTVDSSVSGATILIADGIYNMALVNNP